MLPALKKKSLQQGFKGKVYPVDKNAKNYINKRDNIQALTRLSNWANQLPANQHFFVEKNGGDLYVNYVILRKGVKVSSGHDKLGVAVDAMDRYFQENPPIAVGQPVQAPLTHATIGNNSQ